MEWRRKSYYTPSTVQSNFQPFFCISGFLFTELKSRSEPRFISFRIESWKKTIYLSKNFFVGLYEETMLQEKPPALSQSSSIHVRNYFLQYRRSRTYNLDPISEFFHPGLRVEKAPDSPSWSQISISEFTKNWSIFIQQIVTKRSEIWSWMFIRVPYLGSGFYLSRIPEG